MVSGSNCLSQRDTNYGDLWITRHGCSDSHPGLHQGTAAGIGTTIAPIEHEWEMLCFHLNVICECGLKCKNDELIQET